MAGVVGGWDNGAWSAAGAALIAIWFNLATSGVQGRIELWITSLPSRGIAVDRGR